MAFDGKIKFGKSASEVSNSVDPLSRSVRTAIADEAAKIVGPSNAAELTDYSDFMDAFGDLKSYTDRAAGGEYLLRLVLSGRGGDSRKLIEIVKKYTGIDLMNDATAMKVATDVLGNDNTKNLFRQDIQRAGLDAASVLTGNPIGWGSIAWKWAVEKGIDPEEVLKKAAAGGGAAYVVTLLNDNEGMAVPLGFAIGMTVPTTRRQIVESLAKKVDVPTLGEMQDFSRVLKEGGVSTTNKGELVYKAIDGLSEKQVRNAFDDGLRLIEIDRKTLQAMQNASPREIAKFYDEIIKLTETQPR
jgi:hypothetical protein